MHLGKPFPYAYDSHDLAIARKRPVQRTLLLSIAARHYTETSGLGSNPALSAAPPSGGHSYQVWGAGDAYINKNGVSMDD